MTIRRLIRVAIKLVISPVTISIALCCAVIGTLLFCFDWVSDDAILKFSRYMEPSISLIKWIIE